MRLLLVGVIVLVLAACSSAPGAATIYVDDNAPGDPSVSDPLEDGSAGHPFDAIQEGINAAVDADTVLVKDGTYAGVGNRDLDFGGKAITVRSENGAGTCIIHCQSSGRGFCFRSGETAASVLDGFTVRKGIAACGGGIYCFAGDPTIRNCVIKDNWASDGGGIHVYHGTPTVSHCVIADNVGYDEGGGIYCSQGGDATITDCTITGNSASTYYGGGVKCENWAAPTIADCVIAHNEAFRRGGGIHGGDHCAPTITDCTISDNAAGTYGGGICCKGNPSITGCTIEGNSAEHGGGAYLSDHGSPIVVSCTIAGNTAERDGGGVFCGRSADLTLRGCTITGNSAIWYGGGVHCQYDSSLAIVRCRIEDNSVVWDGGGVYCETSTNTTINACVIVGNSSRKWAGAIECSDSSPLITNCLIANNVADEFAGGISSWGDRFTSDPTIANCTMVGNRAGIYGGGVVCAGDSSATVTNCILWSNGPGQILVDEDATPSFAYCDVQGGWPGTGNISVNPLFVSGPLHGYYLSQTAAGQSANSPCVNAGSDTAANLGLDGLTTRQDGGRDAGIVDLGYHAPPAPYVYAVTRAGDDITVWWKGVAGMDYVVAWSEDRVVWNEAALGAVESWTDVGVLTGTPTGAHCYYRVREDLAAPGAAGATAADADRVRTAPQLRSPRPMKPTVGLGANAPNAHRGGNVHNGAGNVSED